jgi:hypothetical protein
VTFQNWTVPLHTRTPLVPDYFYLIPEQSRPYLGTSYISLCEVIFRVICPIPEYILPDHQIGMARNINKRLYEEESMELNRLRRYL